MRSACLEETSQKWGLKRQPGLLDQILEANTRALSMSSNLPVAVSYEASHFRPVELWSMSAEGVVNLTVPQLPS